MRILVTGGSGVLGRAAIPLLRALGHEVVAPSRHDLDLFDRDAVLAATREMDALYHLATRIPAPERMQHPRAWAENDRLRAEASRVLVDAALAASTMVYVQPTVALVYPPGAVDEDTPLGDVPPHLRSALVAEEHAMRFAATGRIGVVLRLGLLHGPGTSAPRDTSSRATLQVEAAGRGLVAALGVPSGIYNLVDDDNSVSNARFKGVTDWRPRNPG